MQDRSRVHLLGEDHVSGSPKQSRTMLSARVGKCTRWRGLPAPRCAARRARAPPRWRRGRARARSAPRTRAGRRAGCRGGPGRRSSPWRRTARRALAQGALASGARGEKSTRQGSADQVMQLRGRYPALGDGWQVGAPQARACRRERACTLWPELVCSCLPAKAWAAPTSSRLFCSGVPVSRIRRLARSASSESMVLLPPADLRRCPSSQTCRAAAAPLG